jgi:hypothetical protein
MLEKGHKGNQLQLPQHWKGRHSVMQPPLLDQGKQQGGGKYTHRGKKKKKKKKDCAPMGREPLSFLSGK